MSDKNINDQNFKDKSAENVDSSYDETYEDDVTYTEDDSEQWSDDVDLEDDSEAASDEAPPQKKKTSNMTIAIILVVAVIVVFGFMILTGNKGETSQPADATQNPVAIDADAEASVNQPNTTDLKNPADQTANIQTPTAASATAPASAEPQQGLMDNPNLVAQTADNSAVVPSVDAPAPVAPVGDQPPAVLSAPADLAAAPSQELVNTISPTVKPVSDFPTVDSIKKPDAAPAPVMTGAGPAEMAAPTTMEQPNKVAELQTQVDAAQEKIATLEKEISEQAAEIEAQKQAVAKAETAVAPVATGSSISQAEVDALKERIIDLESKLAAKAQKRQDSIADAAPEEKNEYVAAEPVVKKAPAVIKAKPVLKQTWSLKSAGAGKAILSDKLTGDLKTVRVGDVVSGLGRIVSISNANSSWIVKGTLGSVSE